MVLPERAVYATQREPLRQQLAAFLNAAPATTLPGDPFVVIVPDANLTRGGHVAAAVYAALQGHSFDTVILIAPSHAGAFERLNICSVDTYTTPLGDLEVNDLVRNELCDEDDDIFLDDTGHYHTAGIDVQLPYLQTVLPPFSIVPIVMGDESLELCRELGQAVGEVMYNRRTLVVACANLLGGTPEALAGFRTAFEAMDLPRLSVLLNSEQVPMEGKGAVLVAMIAAQHHRANYATILELQPPEDEMPGFLGAALGRR